MHAARPVVVLLLAEVLLAIDAELCINVYDLAVFKLYHLPFQGISFLGHSRELFLKLIDLRQRLPSD